MSSPKISKQAQQEGRKSQIRKLTARYPDNVNAMRDSAGRSPKKSLRRCSQELGMYCWMKSINFCLCHLL